MLELFQSEDARRTWLLEALEHEQDDVRDAATKVLSTIIGFDAERAPMLVRMLKDGQPRRQKRILKMMAGYKRKVSPDAVAAIAEIVQLLDETDVGVRVAAGYVLAEYVDLFLDPAFANMLVPPDGRLTEPAEPGARFAEQFAEAQRDPNGSVPELLRSEYSAVRFVTLAMLKRKFPFDQLRKLSKDSPEAFAGFIRSINQCAEENGLPISAAAARLLNHRGFNERLVVELLRDMNADKWLPHVIEKGYPEDAGAATELLRQITR